MAKPKKQAKKNPMGKSAPKNVLAVKKSAKKPSVKKPIRKKVVLRIKKSPPKKKAPVVKKKKKSAVQTPVKAKAKSVQKARKKKKIKSETESAFASTPFFKAKIRVIGIGGGGGSIVSEIGRSLDRVTFVIADTDVRAFKKRRGIKYFLFGHEFTRGLGTGLNPEIGKAAAEKEKEKITKLFEGQDIVIFISSLGGGLGSGATQVFVDAAKNFGGITFGIFTLPFRFEGRNKQNIAVRSLRDLRRALNVSLTIPNERIFKIINEDTPITEAFSMVNKKLIESLESLIDLIYTPGVINIDFADLRTILKGQGNLAFLNTAEETGKDRSEKIIDKILHNPLYQHQNFIAEKVLFNIVAGSNLGMFEVDRISRAIAEKNPKAKIIFGISKSSKPTNKVKTTLLMTGPPIGEDIHPKETPAPVLVKEEKPLEAAKPNPSVKKTKKKKAKKKKEKDKNMQTPPAGSSGKEVPISIEPLIPAFSVHSLDAVPGVKRLDISEAPDASKKNIRRSALEIKKEQETEENRKSQQEKEWEIPAFLRKIKFKP